MTQQFTKAQQKLAEHCVIKRDRRSDKESYFAFEARSRANRTAGKKQRLCELCRRWCWPEDRCAAFTGPHATSAESSGTDK